ncbi:hypothetical protein EUGRSUZ_K03142, partial [Eucalyptus grandis]
PRRRRAVGVDGLRRRRLPLLQASQVAPDQALRSPIPDSRLLPLSSGPRLPRQVRQASSPLAARGLGFRVPQGRGGRAGAGGQRLQAAAAAAAAAAAEGRQVLRLRSERDQSPAAGAERAADADGAGSSVAGGVLVAGDLEVGNELAGSEEKEAMRHCLNGKFPTVSLFKEYQNAAMAILEKTDYTMISGNPFIKKSGWRKISFYFNLSYEIRDKTIEFDENRNVQRAEFVIRAYMQGGRFSDGWGSCERREKRFSKPNHDIPSTAETRAKNRASQ